MEIVSDFQMCAGLCDSYMQCDVVFFYNVLGYKMTLHIIFCIGELGEFGKTSNLIFFAVVGYEVIFTLPEDYQTL